MWHNECYDFTRSRPCNNDIRQVVYLGDNPKSGEEKAVTLYNKMSRLRLVLSHAEEFWNITVRGHALVLSHTRAKELEVSPYFCKSSVEGYSRKQQPPRTTGLTMCRAEQTPGDKKCPQAKNHQCWQSDVRTMCIDLEGAHKIWEDAEENGLGTDSVCSKWVNMCG